jgi:hypothetical protein
VRFVFDPDAGTFPALEPGERSVLTLKLNNVGSALSQRIVHTLTQDSGFFSANLMQCQNRLQPDDQCDFDVEFAPTAPGDYSAVLISSEVTAGGATATVLLGGNARYLPVALQLFIDGGPGTIGVDSGDAGRFCPPDCTQPYPRFSTLTLTARGVQSEFQQWSGACLGTDASCTLVVSADAGTAVQATFELWPKLTVVRSAPGEDGGDDTRVTLDRGGLDCPGSACTVRVPPATPVVLSVGPFARATWDAGCDAASANRCTTTLQRTQDKTVAVGIELYNRVFVTSTSYPVDLGGITTLDAFCQMAAPFSASWIAWLEVSGSAPSTRLNGARGFVRTDGKPFADQLGDGSKRMFYPPVSDERGNDLSPDAGRLDIATGVMANCNNYSGSSGFIGTGLATAGGDLWSSFSTSTHPCSDRLRLLCVQTDFTTQLLPAPIPDGGRIAFLSFSPVMPSQDPDAQCQSEAIGGRRFAALRATPTAPAWAQLSLDGGTWYRPDGVRLMPAASQLASVSPFALEAPLNLTANGTYVGALHAWTGSAAPGASGTSGTTCGGWSTGAGSAMLGDVFDSSPRWFSGGDGGCGSGLQVYCFEK